MFSGPMFRWEYQTAIRRRRPFLFRTFLTLVLSTLTVLVGLGVLATNLPGGGRVMDVTRLTLFGRVLLGVTSGIELLLLTFFVPAFVAGSIAEERERDTLPLLLLTRLTPIEIVLTKMVARWLPATHLILIGLPVMAVAGLVYEGLLALLVLFSSSAFMAALAILASAQREKGGTARPQAIAWIFGWLTGPPLMTVIPTRTGTLWGDVLTELKALCRLVAPSSPVSLATDLRWLLRPPVVSLEERVALMIGLQMLFGLLILGFAASQLKARERNPNWTDPTRGYRPRCGDDPIYWREFELPLRKGGGSVLVVRLRYVMIIIQAILINALALFTTLLALAVPLGLLVATFHFGLAAFRELWWYGYGLKGPFESRSHFSMLVQMGTGILALFPAINSMSYITERITSERERKTWDVFLTTPLSSREILWSKAHVALSGLWYSAWPLLILWALGLACGALQPLGVAAAAIELLLIVWIAVVLGLYWGIRPVPTSTIASQSAVSALLFFVFHTPLLWALLGSPRQFAEFATWDPLLRWGLVLAGLTVPILTGAAACFLTRQTIDRFDEWVGRPRPLENQRPPGKNVTSPLHLQAMQGDPIH